MGKAITTAIDLFAGLGGFTEAAKASGVRVLWAGNHWPEAVACHTLNHPETQHVCQDLHQANWELVPRMDIILASPACQGHSKARGADKPHHDATRSTAWAVVSCAEFHKPYAFVVENVPEFIKWNLYPAWRLAMEALGYSLSVNVFDAADAGIPQHRERAFIVGTRSRSALTIKPPSQRHVPATSFVGFAGGRWKQVECRGRASATLERVRHGWRHFGDRFLISYYGNTKTARSIDRPIGTITTRDRWAVIDGNRMRMISIPEATAAMGFRADFKLPVNSRLAMHMLGNAVPPGLASHVINEVRSTA